jgi:hypothetical protein
METRNNQRENKENKLERLPPKGVSVIAKIISYPLLLIGTAYTANGFCDNPFLQEAIMQRYSQNSQFFCEKDPHFIKNMLYGAGSFTLGVIGISIDEKIKGGKR